MPNRRFLIIGLTLLALCGWVGADAHAQGAALPQQAGAFVDQLGREAINAMSDRTQSKSRRVEHFRTLLHRGFDLPTIGRFVLGRYWNVATPAQQQEYLKLFEEMIVRSYVERFESYTVKTFRITATRAESERDSFVSTEIVRTNGPPVNVEWRVRNQGQPRIIDVVVEGVSMSVTQRQEFASVIQAKGGNLEAFLQALRDKNAAMASAVQ